MLIPPWRLRYANPAPLPSSAFRGVDVNTNNLARVSKHFIEAGKYYLHLERERALDEVPEVAK